VDANVRLIVALIDHDRARSGGRVGLNRDRRRGRAVDITVKGRVRVPAEDESSVVAGFDVEGIAGLQDAGAVLQGREGAGLRAAVAVAAGGGDVVGVPGAGSVDGHGRGAGTLAAILIRNGERNGIRASRREGVAGGTGGAGSAAVPEVPGIGEGVGR